MKTVDAQNLTGIPVDLFDLALSVPASGNVTLTVGGRSDVDVFSSFALRQAIVADELRIRIDGHVPTKAEALSFVTVENIERGDRDRLNFRRAMLRSPDGTMWDVGIDNAGNLRTRKR